MAAALASRYLQQRGVVGLEVQSAGEVALEGDPATPEAKKVMEEYGLDLEGHRSRALSEKLVTGADLVLTMTLAQRDRLRGRWPNQADKIRALKEYAAGADADAERARILNLAAEVAAGEREQAAGENDPGLKERLDRQARELGELVARVRGYDIADPLGRGLDEYRRCAQEIRAAVEEALARYLGDERRPT